jgi:hypothetical protein
MRWSRLFADLESQVEAMLDAEVDGEVVERTRMEAARLRLVDRLRAAEYHPVELLCAGAGQLRGHIDRVGADWLVLAEVGERDALVPLGSVLAVTGLGRRSGAPGSAGPVVSKLGLSHPLRALARDRAPVQVVLIDGTRLTGTVDRVGADYVELAEHPPDELRRPAAVLRVRALPLHGIGVLRRR